jgi:PHD/YefM family antitoxin component YafN of YafNO toxin-antitoxin module
MRTASLAKVKARLAAAVIECESEGPLVITRNGKAVAVLMAPVDEDDLERFLLARSPRFQAMLDRSRKCIEEGKVLTHEEFWNVVEERSQQREKKKKAPKSRSTK